MNLKINLILLPLLFLTPKLFAENEGLDNDNFFYKQGWLHSTCHYYEEGLLPTVAASLYIDRQIRTMIEQYPYYMVENTISLMSKKFPDCTKGLYLEEQYLKD